MSGWTSHEGLAAGLPLENIDTDQLIPARFMSAPRSEGYGGFLLHDLRFGEDGERRDFPLVEGATVIVARRNFGGGSSREAAVYALVDFGVRAVIAPSFGDIFAANAVNNGLLPARVETDAAEALLAGLEGGAAPLSLSLETLRYEFGDVGGGFEIDAVWREKLINGWDDIDLTARHRDEIAAFAAALKTREPWAKPRRDVARNGARAGA